MNIKIPNGILIFISEKEPDHVRIYTEWNGIKLNIIIPNNSIMNLIHNNTVFPVEF